MRKEEAAAGSGADGQQRLLVCAFEVDRVGLVLAPKAVDSQRFKILRGYGPAVKSLVGSSIAIELLAQVAPHALRYTHCTPRPALCTCTPSPTLFCTHGIPSPSLFYTHGAPRPALYTLHFTPRTVRTTPQALQYTLYTLILHRNRYP